MHLRLSAILALTLGVAVPVSAQRHVSIAELQPPSSAAAARLGDTVSITGRVTLGYGTLDVQALRIFVQDASGGVLVESPRWDPADRVLLGDSVEATGRLAWHGTFVHLEDAQLRVTRAGRRFPAPTRVESFGRSDLARHELELVTVEGFVANAVMGRGTQTLMLADTTADGNYVAIVDDVDGNAELKLGRFEQGDRLRVTGVLARRTSQRTGLTRYTVYPRSIADITSLSMTAQTRRALIWSGVALAALLLAVAYISRTVANRRRAAQAVRERVSSYQRLVEQAPVGIVAYEHERILFANTAFADLVGARADALVGTSFLGLVHEEDREDARRALNETGTHALQFDRSLRRLTRADGNEVEVEITVSTIQHGDVLCRQAVVYDVSERRRAERALAESEAQLRQAQKLEAVGHLAGGVAHDFNNILTVIQGNVSFMLEGCVKCGTVGAEAREIEDAVQRAASLTRQLLAFSRKQVIQPTVFELDPLLRNMEGLLRRLLPENVAQVFDLGAGDAFVRADTGQIEQIVMNLAVNARDAMPKGGQLTVRTAIVPLDGPSPEHVADASVVPGEYVVLTVRDTGSGMDLETQRRAFEPFFTTKEQGKGTGLGLSTVYGIVKQSDGHIVLDSRPGVGSTFRIYLPRASAEALLVAHEPRALTTKASGRTILIVEDEPAIRDIAARTLRGAGHRVLAANDGFEALRLVRQHEGVIHLLLTDVILPGLSGTEIANHLVRSRRDLPVLYMSGYTDDLVVPHGVLESGVDLLQKPFTPSQLLERVERAMAPDTIAASA